MDEMRKYDGPRDELMGREPDHSRCGHCGSILVERAGPNGEAAIVGHQILVSLDIDALPELVRRSAEANNWPGEYKVEDQKAFAKELVYALNSESENGSTDVHRLFDEAILAAINSGAEGIEVGPDRETLAGMDCLTIRK